MISFTGSGPVGYSIHGCGTAQARDPGARRQRGRGRVRRLVLRRGPGLGHGQDRDVRATTRAASPASRCSGLLVDRAVYDRVLERHRRRRWRAQVTGDPRDDATDVGPLVDEARRDPGRGLGGRGRGRRRQGAHRRDAYGATYAPTVLVDVPADARLRREEIFGPVLTVTPFDGVDEAFAAGQRQPLRAAGRRLHPRPADRLRALIASSRSGGVVVGDVPSFRADQMPYGGVKESGVGREGLQATRWPTSPTSACWCSPASTSSSPAPSR